jgi:cell division septal protein FtsQ
VHTALSFVECFNRSGMGTRVRLERLDLSKPGVFVATTADGARVTLGAGDFHRQLARWRAIHQEAQRRHKKILTMDLAVRNNVPVRWEEAKTAASGPSTG